MPEVLQIALYVSLGAGCIMMLGERIIVRRGRRGWADDTLTD